MAQSKTVKRYFNDPQQIVIQTAAKDTVFVGGRGIGKATLHAWFNLRNFQMMPRCSVGFVVPTFKKALTNTLPSMFQVWEEWGYKRDVHYFVGVKPPKSAGFPLPLYPVADYSHVITFYTGAVGYILSQDVVGAANSLSYDALDVDEAKFINFDRLKDEAMPANRGQQKIFGHLSFHHGMLITSDMPVTKKGSWFLNYQDKCDKELIEAIQSGVCELYRLKRKIDDIQAAGGNLGRLLTDYRDLRNDIEKMRSVALYYGEFSSIWNMQILGEQYINQMKRDLPPLTFQTSILCKRIGITKDGFYSCLTEKHLYTAYDNSYLLNKQYQFKDLQVECCLQDADLIEGQPICIGMDYNANINWLVAGQVDGNKIKVIKSFYVKYERKLPELVADFCAYYRPHNTHEVIFYYDSTALGSNYAVNDEDFKFVITQEFERWGWLVTPVYIGNPMAHHEKYLLINRMLSGQANLMPMFNEGNNEDLLISIRTAGVYNNRKDKRGEKLAETEEDKLENRTDGSDAFDTLVIGCERFPYQTTHFLAI
jgi:hypothetical protein